MSRTGSPFWAVSTVCTVQDACDKRYTGSSLGQYKHGLFFQPKTASWYISYRSNKITKTSGEWIIGDKTTARVHVHARSNRDSALDWKTPKPTASLLAKTYPKRRQFGAKRASPSRTPHMQNHTWSTWSSVMPATLNHTTTPELKQRRRREEASFVCTLTILGWNPIAHDC